jgi:transcription antitermination factor NusG
MELPHDLRSVYELAIMAAAEASVRTRERLAMRVTGEERWYLTHIGARSDDTAIQKLSNNGFEIYYPKLRKMVPIPLKRLSDKQRRAKFRPFEPKLVPLFPKYLPIRFDLRRGDWRDVFEFAGIWGLQVQKGADRPIPVAVSDALIESIRAREVDGAVPGEISMRKFAFEVGELVRVTEGVFKGFDAIVEALPDIPFGELDEDALGEFTVSLFGRPNLVEMPLSHVAKRPE